MQATSQRRLGSTLATATHVMPKNERGGLDVNPTSMFPSSSFLWYGGHGSEGGVPEHRKQQPIVVLRHRHSGPNLGQRMCGCLISARLRRWRKRRSSRGSSSRRCHGSEIHCSEPQHTTCWLLWSLNPGALREDAHMDNRDKNEGPEPGRREEAQ